ncbi:hypothetical protein [Streptomyces canus]|uniref:hypothetical protein n=1 Tax=Streptomyces canus TaxID=58343 RepID=UPI0027839B93|nr:hypothetical protein [Streptomyces canus]MDQ1065031.1 hypothetical protein [Streptomyces canus]
MFERMYAGLDVHVRSVVGAAIDGVLGEIRSLRLAPEAGTVVPWVASLPGPVAVAYEAGPTGFGLAGVDGGGCAVRGGGPVQGRGAAG